MESHPANRLQLQNLLLLLNRFLLLLLLQSLFLLLLLLQNLFLLLLLLQNLLLLLLLLQNLLQQPRPLLLAPSKAAK